MSSTDVHNQTSAEVPAPGVVDMNLEVIVLGVADVDKAKAVLRGPWLEARRRCHPWRGLPFGPVHPSGLGVLGAVRRSTSRSAAPGSGQSPYLIVSDVEAARADLVARGVDVSEVFHEGSPGARFHEATRVAGPSPDRSSYGSFATFSDPDGNGWLFQEVTTRLPGRIDPTTTTFASASDLAGCASACVGRPRRAREADRRGGRQLAGLVRPVHGGRAGGQRTADLTPDDAVIGGVGMGPGIRTVAPLVRTGLHTRALHGRHRTIEQPRSKRCSWGVLAHQHGPHENRRWKTERTVQCHSSLLEMEPRSTTKIGARETSDRVLARLAVECRRVGRADVLLRSAGLPCDRARSPESWALQPDVGPQRLRHVGR